MTDGQKRALWEMRGGELFYAHSAEYEEILVDD